MRLRMHECYKSVVNEMVVNAGDVPVYKVVVELQHTELGVLVYEEPDVMRQVVVVARLAGRHLIGVVGDDIELPKALVVYACGGANLRAILDIPVTIDIRHRLPIRRVA